MDIVLDGIKRTEYSIILDSDRPALECTSALELETIYTVPFKVLTPWLVKHSGMLIANLGSRSVPSSRGKHIMTWKNDSKSSRG